MRPENTTLRIPSNDAEEAAFPTLLTRDNGHPSTQCHPQTSLMDLPISLLPHLGSFLSVNDLTSLALTNRRVYSDTRWYKSCDDNDGHPFQLASVIFQLVREESLPPKKEVKSVLQPFQFLFQSPLYGVIQVTLSIVHAPMGGYPRGTPQLCGSFPEESPTGNSDWEKVRIRVEICKKFPNDNHRRPNNNQNEKDGLSLSTAGTIFRYDESIPGCCFYFESKYIVQQWQAGHLGHLLHLCAQRASVLRTPVLTLAGDDVTQCMLQPPVAQDVKTRFQAALREQAMRTVRLMDDEANEE